MMPVADGQRTRSRVAPSDGIRHRFDCT